MRKVVWLLLLLRTSGLWHSGVSRLILLGILTEKTAVPSPKGRAEELKIRVLGIFLLDALPNIPQQAREIFPHKSYCL